MVRPILFAFAFSALVCDGATSFAQDPNKLFNVPFFIENILPPAPNALRANFTLQHPAILKSLSMTCAGGPQGGLLLVDGGPLGVHSLEWGPILRSAWSSGPMLLRGSILPPAQVEAPFIRQHHSDCL